MRLNQMRKEYKYTKNKVAEFLNVHKTTYGKWENNIEPIPTRRLYELANLYKVNIDYLVGISNIKLKISSSDYLDLKQVGSLVSLADTEIKELRLELNMTLREIAEKISISNVTWSTYELGKVLINSTYLIEMCKLTNISLDYVLCRSKVKYLDDYK